MYEKANDRKVEMNYGRSCYRKYGGDEGKGKYDYLAQKADALYVVIRGNNAHTSLFMVE